MELNKVDILEALNKVASYMEEAEKNHYEESSPQSQAVHIYNSVVIIQEWLKAFEEEAFKGVALLIKDRLACVSSGWDNGESHFMFLNEKGDNILLKSESLDDEVIADYLGVDIDDLPEDEEKLKDLINGCGVLV
jgi:uncharacterized protein with HEPN domain